MSELLSRILSNARQALHSALWILVAVLAALAVNVALAFDTLTDRQWMSVLWLCGLLFIWLSLFNYLHSSQKPTVTDKALALAVALLGAFAMTAYAATSGDAVAAAATLWLVSDLPLRLNELIGLTLPHVDPDSLSRAAPSFIPADSAADVFGDRVVTIAGIALGTVLSTTVVIRFSKVYAYLEKILNILGLSDQQLAFARKLSAKAKSAIPDNASLAQLYPKEVQFFSPNELRRQFPLISGSGQRARIKLIVTDNALPTVGTNFRWDVIGGLLNSADISLQNSIFSICKRGSKEQLTIFAYGAGSELQALFEMTEEYEPGLDIRTAFARALDRNNITEIVNVVVKARKLLLKRGSDVLLSTTVAAESGSLEVALSTMRDAGLNRIMLTSSSAPQERGILGAAEINRFLMG